MVVLDRDKGWAWAGFRTFLMLPIFSYCVLIDNNVDSAI